MTIVYTHFVNNSARHKVAMDVVTRSARCCGAATNACATPDSRTRIVFKKWFGVLPGVDGKDNWEDVTGILNRMNYYLSGLSLTVEDAAATLSPNTNAEASHFQSAQTKSYQDRETTAAHAGVKIKLTDRFFNHLPRVQSDDQTQIETFLHELSHIAAGTKDMERADHTPNPQPCYGRVNALNLATNFPAQARNNAENFGFFIAEIGGEVPVVSAQAPVGQSLASGAPRKWAVVEAPKLTR